MPKRPDQHNIDPDEAGATDYKTYPDEPAERVADKGTVEQGKGQPIKPSVPAPDRVKEGR